jgi:hypothetical protein
MTKSEVYDFWPIREIYAPSTVENADNGWLGELGGILEVQMVNGAGAQELPEFKPIQHELFLLAKYWAETAIAIEFSWFLKEKLPGSSGLQRRFARERLRRIRSILGSEVDKFIDEAIRSYGAKQDWRDWKAFLDGGTETDPSVF